ncbi:hypothetical protein ACG9H2_05640 [Acinetobacter ursingii]|uniref:hypothetical protein n=1 Tax=Acinetobacter ursingii TaxID=108980 RepID=UPI003AF6D901
MSKYDQMDWKCRRCRWINECWQGPFNSKARCIQHLEECIQEMREEQAQENAK